MTIRIAALLGLLGLAEIACNASTTIGESPGAAGATGSALGVGGSGTCMAQQDPMDLPFAPPAGVAGVWTGYFQGTGLAVGDDAIKLTIDPAAADGSNQIHIVFGSTPPPAPATDATAGYPPAGTHTVYTVYAGSEQALAGFNYVGHEVQWIGQRLRFGVATAQALDSWCQLQKSYESRIPGQNPEVSYSCVPGIASVGKMDADGGTLCFAVLDSQGTEVPVDCDQQQMCQGRGSCVCDTCGCAAPVVGYPNADVTFDGDVATGAVGPGSLSIHLTRAAN
jgi:hypothetical protein